MATELTKAELAKAARKELEEFDRLRKVWHSSEPGLAASVAATREREVSDRCLQHLIAFIELAEAEVVAAENPSRSIGRTSSEERNYLF